MELILLWLVLSIVVAVWYGNKGGGWFAALVVSLIFSPLLGALFVAVSNPGPKCPYCQERIKRGAAVCPHCRTRLTEHSVRRIA